jgi:ring-1,2-phenylacetyl-CoA epoxidase subunit PaaD
MTAVHDTRLIEKNIYNVLENVKDPELPSISIVELGMLHKVTADGSSVRIELLPTFSGCPALDMIETDVVNAVKEVDGVEEINVAFVFDPPWTTDRISPAGRDHLKEYGISPPPADHQEGEPWEVDCPYCGSPHTTMENIFGPTACRSILYCTHCKNPFEAMKPIATM